MFASLTNFINDRYLEYYRLIEIISYLLDY